MSEDIYEQMFLQLFNAITDIRENHRDDSELAFVLLETAQLDCGTMYREYASAYETRRTLLGGLYIDAKKKKTR